MRLYAAGTLREADPLADNTGAALVVEAAWTAASTLLATVMQEAATPALV